MLPPLLVAHLCTVTLPGTTQQGYFREMRRVYSRSSAQMKNSLMGRPTSRTTFAGISSDTNVAAPAGMRPPEKSRRLRMRRSRCTFIRQIAPSVHSALPDSQPNSPMPSASHISASSAAGSGIESSSMIHTYSQPFSTAFLIPNWKPPAPPRFFPVLA